MKYERFCNIILIINLVYNSVKRVTFKRKKPTKKKMTRRYPSQPPSRPTGVTILASLVFLSGIIFLINGLLAIVFPDVKVIFICGNAAFNAAGATKGAIMIGTFFIIMGIIASIIAWGLWTLQSWAWWVTFIFALISVISYIIELNFTGGFIVILIFLYLISFEGRDPFGIRFPGDVQKKAGADI